MLCGEAGTNVVCTCNDVYLMCTQCVRMLCGEAGTQVKVSFQRDGVPGEQEAVIQRKEVKLRDVPLRHICI